MEIIPVKSELVEYVLGVAAAGAPEMEGGEVARGAGAVEIDVLGVTAAGAPEMEGGEVARGAGAVEIDVLGVTVRAVLIEGGVALPG